MDICIFIFGIKDASCIGFDVGIVETIGFVIIEGEKLDASKRCVSYPIQWTRL